MPPSKQLLLPGMPVETPQKNRLALALLPDAAACRQIAEIAQRLRAKLGLKGRLISTNSFHVSLHHLGDFHRLPENIIEAAGIAAMQAAAATPPFEVRFDRANSFVNRPTHRPCVLLDGGGNAALRAFRFDLVTAFGAERSNQSFTPHLTMLYDDRTVVEELVTPVSWTAHELVLLQSVLREGPYEFLGRWPLQG